LIRAPARIYAGVAGATLDIAGIIGFFYSADFGSPGEVAGVFGVLDANAWQNVLHILTGALGLLAFGAGAQAARRYALAVGAVYIVIGIWGLPAGSGDSILGILPVNTGADVFHLLIGAGGLSTFLVAGVATPEGPQAAPNPSRDH
jgi:hypothetical protein